MHLRVLTVLVLLFVCTLPCAAGGNDFLGLEGEPVTDADAEGVKFMKGKTGFKVTRVVKGGEAAKAGVEVGDIVTQVGRSTFKVDDDIWAVIDEEVTKAQEKAGRSSKGEQKIDIRVVRDGKKEKFTAFAFVPGKHPSACPDKCRTCEHIAEKALDWCVKKQNANGGWKAENGGTFITTCTIGLAMFAQGSDLEQGPYSEPLQKLTKFMMTNWNPKYKGQMDNTGWGFENWHLGIAGIFFAEVYAHHPEDQYKKRCIEIAEAIAEAQEPSGGWCHRSTKIGMKMGYAELQIVGNWCMAALGCIKQLGLKVNSTTITRGVNYFQQVSSADGGVGYSTRPGQKAMGQTGRNGGAVWALERCGQKSNPLFGKASDWFKNNLEKVPEGHGTPVMHYLTSAIAAELIGKEAWDEYWSLFRDKMLGLRRDDGSFGPSPSDVSAALGLDMEKTVGRAWTTGTYALIFQLKRGNLRVFFGKPKKG
jgi:hypothetical protein